MADFMIEYALFYRVQAQINTVKCNVHTIKKTGSSGATRGILEYIFFSWNSSKIAL